MVQLYTLLAVSFGLTLQYRKYHSGATGSFTHLATLQGTDYSCEFEVFADGYALKYVSSAIIKKTLAQEFVP